MWKDIQDYEGWYQVSADGKIKSLDRVVPHKGNKQMRVKGRILKLILSEKGYLRVNLSREGHSKDFKVHQLVAQAFLGPCPEGMEVCHGVDGQQNNSLENLTYNTHTSNSRDKWRDKTMYARKVVRGDGEVFKSIREAAKSVQKSEGFVGNVCNGRKTKAGGHTWSYA